MAQRGRGGKIYSRIRSGGVVVSRTRLISTLQSDPGSKIVGNKKLRIAGAPHRKALAAKK